MLSKTANASYKEYLKAGGTLSFTDYLHREKEKFMNANGEQDNLLLINRPLNDSIQTAIKETLKQGGLKNEESGKTVFGINKNIIIGGGILIAVGIAFIIYKKVKK